MKHTLQVAKCVGKDQALASQLSLASELAADNGVGEGQTMPIEFPADKVAADVGKAAARMQEQAWYLFAGDISQTWNSYSGFSRIPRQ